MQAVVPFLPKEPTHVYEVPISPARANFLFRSKEIDPEELAGEIQQHGLFNQLKEMTKELELQKTAIERIDKLVQSRLEAVGPQIEEILSNVREQRRSSVTHYSQLAATVAQGFESLGELRSASTDKPTLDLLTETLHAAHDALYCLRMERLISRYLSLQEQIKGPLTMEATDSTQPAKSK